MPYFGVFLPNAFSIKSIKNYLAKSCSALAQKMSVKYTPNGANVIKPFKAVIYHLSNLVNVFVPGKPFRPSLIFVIKARAYLSEAPLRCSTLVKSFEEEKCFITLTPVHQDVTER